MAQDQTETTHLHSVSVPRARVRVTSGADEGKEVELAFSGLVIGSGPNADFRLADGAVSREHAKLSLLPSGVRLQDLGSKNGTWLGDVRVNDVLLPGVASITIGKSVLTLSCDALPAEVPLSDQTSFGECFGTSAPMRHVFSLLERAARSDISVLLEGESGVGKEVLARAIHDGSPRARGPFVAFDCGAVSPALIESELFGHERGAFTGATASRIGHAKAADKGTLFLDEIGELPLDLQPKLLRLLELHEVRPVGATKPSIVDVRIISATNRRLAEAAQRGELRTDLFYRLAVAKVTVPPLRDRGEDIALLANRFLARLRGQDAEFPPHVLRMFESYAWPGNVRELRNAVERFVHLGVTDRAALLDHSPSEAASALDLSNLPYDEAKQKFTSAYVKSVLARSRGVVAHAAEMAQVSRPTFYRMMEALSAERGDPGRAGERDS